MLSSDQSGEVRNIYPQTIGTRPPSGVLPGRRSPVPRQAGVTPDGRTVFYPLDRRVYDSGVWRIAVWRISASRASKIVNARRSFMGRFS